MKTIDIDWAELMAFTGRWDRLNAKQRVRAIALGGSDACDASLYGADLAELEAAGMLETFKEGSRVRVAAEFRPALKVLRLMDRVDVFASRHTFHDYIREVLTGAERSGLIVGRHWDTGSIQEAILTSRKHLESFLTGDALAWERKRAPEEYLAGPSSALRSVLVTKRDAEDVRQLLRSLMSRPKPVAIGELKSSMGQMSERRLADAIWAGLRYALCVAGFDEDGRPALGLWPAVSQRLHRPVATVPETVEPDVSSVMPWAIDDLVQLLVFCGEPRRELAGGNGFFVKVLHEFEALLTPMPEWLMKSEALEIRTNIARQSAERSAFVESFRDGARGRRVQTSSEGRKWLALRPQERARTIVDVLRFDLEDSRMCSHTEFYLPSDNPIGFKEAFSGLSGPVRMAAFLRYNAEANNPLLEAFDGERVDLNDEQLEEEWAARLQICIQRILAPNGGVQLGRLNGELTFELTAAGRYILGLTKSFDWAQSIESTSIFVQPDFEIVFLEPNPSLEATVTRFAERLGQGVGVLFRLTRVSIQNAVQSGMSADEVLTTLAEASNAPLPENVRSEITTWAASTVQLAFEAAQILRCPDEPTATRVLAAAKGKLQALSPTILAFVDPKQRAAILRDCRKAGVFLDVEVEHPKPSRRRRRSRW